MLVEVNDLKGLIIDIKPDILLSEWIELDEKYQCVFLISSDEEASLLEGVISSRSKILIKNNSYFIKSLLKQAVNCLNLRLNQIAFVTSNPLTIQSIINEPIGTIMITQSILYEHIGHMPDLIAPSITELKTTLENYPGYFSEVKTTIIGDNSFSDSGRIFNFNLSYDQFNINVISLGRYFGTKHHKHRIHQFSHRLRKSKTDSSQNELFWKLIVPIIKRTKYDGITRVPPRPSDERDRLGMLLSQLSMYEQINNFSDYLLCLEDFPKQKQQANSEERRINVRGKFRATEDVVGKEILLIDDIFTTGATVGECAKTLMNKGAKSVTILVLAVNQFDSLFPVQRQPLMCPDKCGGILQLRINKNGKGAFFGCSNFFNRTCNKILAFNLGWRRINSSNSFNETEELEEIDF
ncbi:phosphoribosyltransferase family protein [Paenibacillus segetis]|uniref:Phosphoribosyltransferase domain-containing protein n=1 Tax=Paenibacillus segetis TaxID=1325360 RepID=A0ABQ1YAJ6_9BACL|nr:phosphoribosyltransferase family protein [Paenibacillus segetis]GGH17452.1 hypothetical protein GCM10008013_12800 [Paenibacillus segetis]